MPSRSSPRPDVFRHVAAYVPPLALGRDVFRHVPAYVPLLVRDRDVFRHVPAYDPLLAPGRDVFRHVPAYVAPPLLQTPQDCRASFGPPSLRSLRSAASLAPDQCSQFLGRPCSSDASGCAVLSRSRGGRPRTPPGMRTRALHREHLPRTSQVLLYLTR